MNNKKELIGLVKDLYNLKRNISSCLTNAESLEEALEDKFEGKYEAYVRYMNKLNSKRWIKRAIATRSQFANMSFMDNRHPNDNAYSIRLSLRKRREEIRRLESALKVVSNSLTTEMFLDEDFYHILKVYDKFINVEDYFELRKYY